MQHKKATCPVKSVFSMSFQETYYTNKEVKLGDVILKENTMLSLVEKMNVNVVMMKDIYNKLHILNINDLKSTFEDLTDEKVRNYKKETYPVKSVFSMSFQETYYTNKEVKLGDVVLKENTMLALVEKKNVNTVVMKDIYNKSHVLNINDLKSTFEDLTGKKVRNIAPILIKNNEEDIVIDEGSLFTVEYIYTSTDDVRHCSVIFEYADNKTINCVYPLNAFIRE